MITKSFLVSSLVVLISMAAEINVFGARGVDLPPEEFLARGAWVLLGEVIELKVVGQKWNSEYGNIVIRVDEVLEGKVNSALVNFPYDRWIKRGTNPVNWNMLHERPEVGKKYIIFFGEAVGGWGRKRNDGTYSVFSGTNSVKEVSSYDDLEVVKLREAVRSHRLPK